MRVLSARVSHLKRRPAPFRRVGNDLAANRAVRILAIDQIEEVRSHGKRELVSREQNPGALFWGQGDFPLELGKVRDSVFKLPFPVVPELGSDAGPVSWRMGMEPPVGDFS